MLSEWTATLNKTILSRIDKKMNTPMTLCKNCGKGIKWFKDPVNDKWIPLEADCNLEYESPEEVDMDEVLQWKHKCIAVLTCNKGCVLPFLGLVLFCVISTS